VRVLRRDLFLFGLVLPALLTLVFAPLLWQAYQGYLAYGVGAIGAWIPMVIGPWAFSVVGCWVAGISMIRERRRLLREEFRVP